MSKNSQVGLRKEEINTLGYWVGDGCVHGTLHTYTYMNTFTCSIVPNESLITCTTRMYPHNMCVHVWWCTVYRVVVRSWIPTKQQKICPPITASPRPSLEYQSVPNNRTRRPCVSTSSSPLSTRGPSIYLPIP